MTATAPQTEVNQNNPAPGDASARDAVDQGAETTAVFSKLTIRSTNTTFPNGTLGLLVDPITKEPRVVVRCDKDNDELIVTHLAKGSTTNGDKGINDENLTLEGTEVRLKFDKGFKDPKTFRAIDDVWERLGAYPRDINSLTWAARQLEKIAGHGARFVHGNDEPGLAKDFLDKLDSQTIALMGNGPRRINSLENALTGRDVYEIDMSHSRSALSWNKMQVAVENGYVFVTLQSTGRAKPSNFKRQERDTFDGPTSVTLKLGKLEDLSVEDKNGLSGMKKFFGGGNEQGVLSSFISHEGAHKELFRDSKTLRELLSFEDVHLRSIYNAKIADTTLYGIRMTIGAEIANTTFENCKVGVYGQTAWRGVHTKNCVMSLIGPVSDFDECYFDRGTQVAGDLRGSFLKNNTHWHSNFISCDISDLRFQEGQYTGLAGLGRLSHLRFTRNKSPVELQNGFMAEFNTQDEDRKLFNKMNRHRLINSDSLLEDLHNQAHSIFTTGTDYDYDDGCGTYGPKVLPNGKMLRGGKFLKIYRRDGEEMTLYLEKDLAKNSWAKVFLERRGADGEAKDLVDWSKGLSGLTPDYNHLPVAHLLDLVVRWKFGYGAPRGGLESTGAINPTEEQQAMNEVLDGTSGNAAKRKTARDEERREAVIDAQLASAKG